MSDKTQYADLTGGPYDGCAWKLTVPEGRLPDKIIDTVYDPDPHERLFPEGSMQVMAEHRRVASYRRVRFNESTGRWVYEYIDRPLGRTDGDDDE